MGKGKFQTVNFHCRNANVNLEIKLKPDSDISFSLSKISITNYRLCSTLLCAYNKLNIGSGTTQFQ